jgi:hypothetical protein
MSRRASETYEKMPPHKTTNLEKNCGQIFAKGPALTREILDKMHKNRTYILGYEIETKQFWSEFHHFNFCKILIQAVLAKSCYMQFFQILFLLTRDLHLVAISRVGKPKFWQQLKVA